MLNFQSLSQSAIRHSSLFNWECEFHILSFALSLPLSISDDFLQPLPYLGNQIGISRLTKMTSPSSFASRIHQAFKTPWRKLRRADRDCTPSMPSVDLSRSSSLLESSKVPAPVTSVEEQSSISNESYLPSYPTFNSSSSNRSTFIDDPLDAKYLCFKQSDFDDISNFHSYDSGRRDIGIRGQNNSKLIVGGQVILRRNGFYR